MTATVDDIGRGGDVAVASLIVDAHRRCRDCAAGTCEAGTWAAQLLAAHRQHRQQLLHQMTGRNQRPTEYQGAH